MNPLDELERLHREATPGPLRAYGAEIKGEHPDYDLAIYDEGGHTAADARILATSRNIVPQVIALARALQENEDEWEPTVTSTEVAKESVFAALDALLQAIESEVAR